MRKATLTKFESETKRENDNEVWQGRLCYELDLFVYKTHTDEVDSGYSSNHQSTTHPLITHKLHLLPERSCGQQSRTDYYSRVEASVHSLVWERLAKSILEKRERSVVSRDPITWAWHLVLEFLPINTPTHLGGVPLRDAWFVNFFRELA